MRDYDGETLRVVRAPCGAVTYFDLGSFVLTRQPYGPAEVVPRPHRGRLLARLTPTASVVEYGC